MPRPRFDNLPADKRKQILDAAAQAFAEHGYEGASISKILARAGISTGAAYYYFDNKADLFASVVQHTFDTLFSGLQPNLQSTDADSFWIDLESLLAHAGGDMFEPHRTLAALKAAWRSSSEARSIPKVAEIFDLQHQVVHSLLDHGVRVGAIRTDLPNDLLAHVLLAIDSAVDDWMLERGSGFGPDAMAAMMPAMLHAVRGLLERKEHGP